MLRIVSAVLVALALFAPVQAEEHGPRVVLPEATIPGATYDMTLQGSGEALVSVVAGTFVTSDARCTALNIVETRCALDGTPLQGRLTVFDTRGWIQVEIDGQPDALYVFPDSLRSFVPFVTRP